LDIQVVRPSELGQHDLNRWENLQLGNPATDSPFLHPQFAIAIEEVRCNTRVAVIADEGAVIGFFAFERNRWGNAIALGKGLSDVQGLVTSSTIHLDMKTLLRACGIRLFEFDHLLAAQQSSLIGVPSRFSLKTSPAIHLEGGFDHYLERQQTFSKSLFQSTARKRRKLEREHGPVRLILHKPDHLLLDQVLTWKSNQYQRTGRRDRFGDSNNRALVHSLLELNQTNFGAVLTLLFAGDSFVAGHLGLRSRHTLAWWFPVYNPEFAAYSPGLVMCLDLARAMVDENLHILDLGKGDEEYKQKLSNKEIQLLDGSAAGRPLTQNMHTVRNWPVEQVMNIVLKTPQLRRFSRTALAQVGDWRVRFSQSKVEDRHSPDGEDAH
jgi:CelD/BcsL family acetyltransferase involved in cellulose biosynthesis